jgi:hypothetical protein
MAMIATRHVVSSTLNPPPFELAIGAADQPLPAAGHPRQRSPDGSPSGRDRNPLPRSISPAYLTTLMAIMRSKLS